MVWKQLEISIWQILFKEDQIVDIGWILCAYSSSQYMYWSYIFEVSIVMGETDRGWISLLAPHGAQAVIAFRYPPLLPYYNFQIFSSNLSKPMSRGGINWSLCGSNSLGTSHSTQGRDDSSSSSIAGLNCIYSILVYSYQTVIRQLSDIYQTVIRQCLDQYQTDV